MRNSRLERINDEMMREIANIIRAQLKDPRVGAMTSVTKVATTNDLSHCKVFVSVLGDDKQKADAMEGLVNAAGFIRKQIAANINLRATPQLVFVLDDTMEYSMKIDKLIKETHTED